ncbi:helix-turn-helix domain-containing protein [Lawsonibacter sp. LCP25S3_G6]|uniref:helix-turn-helix domain-containing protein n=1 Tax=unclassified Lawsonibacter TaxID=2617946 RepID=UPI003F98332A
MKESYHSLYRTMGLNIMYYRNLRDFSQDELGAMVDKDQSHISKIERGSVGISLDTLFDIAKALNVDPYLLLKPKE